MRKWAMVMFLKEASQRWLLMSRADGVAKVALALAGRKNPPARVPVGLEYKVLMQLLRIMPDRAKEAILSKMYLPK